MLGRQGHGLQHKGAQRGGRWLWGPTRQGLREQRAMTEKFQAGGGGGKGSRHDQICILKRLLCRERAGDPREASQEATATVRA